ncbi:MFS transporter [Parendozoicomonas haliclonae]|uniref:Inner membrane symporter YicJ n=1 Tax=Parendozoicomonas haliclonae TaxID=1960125 RepID=A0A1X7AKG8_9GAMM|nr:MFS transporter [Parendozoicomonas haliclonae]SMA47333.1 Inner membrane symporter YicJ [Parendozoicomonas haliclonae]
MTTPHSDRRLSLREKIYYSAGNFGNGISSGILMFWLVYFFFPPADMGIPYHIPQGSLWLGLTVIGAILAANRLVDAMTDSWIANVCNRSRNPKGKYLPMMRLAAPGNMLFTCAIFFLPNPGQISTLNIIWITCAIGLQALCLTMYMVPYYALQIKIAPDVDDKLDLNTIMGAFWFAGLVLGSFSSVFWDLLIPAFNLDKVTAMQLVFAGLVLLGVLALWIPTFLLKESEYEDVEPEATVQPKFMETARIILNDQIYMRFLQIIALYYLATFMFESGMTYFLTVLAQMPETSIGLITSITGVLSIACYPIVNKLGKKKGKKPLIGMGFLMFGLSLFIVSIMGLFNIPSIVLVVILVLVSPMPQAIMGILPGAITADIAAYAKAHTGQDNSSFYIAGNMFVAKLAGTFSMLIFTSLLLLGKDVGNDLGIRLTAVVAMVICFIAYLLSRTYNEKEVLTYTQPQNIKTKAVLYPASQASEPEVS